MPKATPRDIAKSTSAYEDDPRFHPNNVKGSDQATSVPVKAYATQPEKIHRGEKWSAPETYAEVTERFMRKGHIGEPGCLTIDQATGIDRFWRSLGKKIAAGARIKDAPLFRSRS